MQDRVLSFEEYMEEMKKENETLVLQIDMSKAALAARLITVDFPGELVSHTRSKELTLCFPHPWPHPFVGCFLLCLI